jgi:hypothetical protein
MSLVAAGDTITRLHVGKEDLRQDDGEPVAVTLPQAWNALP